jgi:hypothetical protein
MKHALLFSKFALTAIVLMLCSSQAYAIGLGFIVGGSYENWRVNKDVEGSDPNYRGDRRVINWGGVFDTTVRKDRYLGYRLTVRMEKNNGGKIDMQGLSATHDLTLGLVRTKTMRVWVGPELKLTYYNELTLNTNEDVVYNSSDGIGQSGLGDVWGFGFGPAVGLNIHRQKLLSFSFSAAALATSYTGDTDYSTRDGKQYGDLHVNSLGLYLSAGIIFRIKE